jgi:hypothetical protein
MKLLMLVGIQVLNLIFQLRLDADLAWSMGYVLGDFTEATVPLFQSFMDEGGSDAGLSTLPDLNATPRPDLNVTPSPESEPGPEPEPPAPAEEELLIRNREKAKEDLRILLQLGYDKQARRAPAVAKILDDLNIDGEGDATFLDTLRDHVTHLCHQYCRPPRKFDKKGLADLKGWILRTKRERDN